MKILLILITFYLCIFANEVAEIKGLIGDIRSVAKDSVRKVRLKVGDKLLNTDTLYTYHNSFVILALNDGNKIVLDENTKLVFSPKNEIEQRGGKLYFEIAKKTSNLNLKTEFSIISLKGVENIIVTDNSIKSIALKSGKTTVKSPNEGFEIDEANISELNLDAGNIAVFNKNRVSFEPLETLVEFDKFKELK